MRFLRLNSNNQLTLTQRWATYLSLILAITLIVFGTNFRNRILFRAIFYQDETTGIKANYPINWLIDTNQADYIFRVRDMQYVGFKTTIQLSVIPIGADTTERNVADQLALSRSQTFTDYRQLSIQPYSLKNANDSQSVLYTYVSRESSPFLESIPTVVIGNDIIIISRGQAIVITFRADTLNYDVQQSIFERFLSSLEF